jgi:uncharacterized membrane protein YhaH (DUF805 family)
MPEPGWYVDPHDPARIRWWDGAGWTEAFQAAVSTPPPPSHEAVAHGGKDEPGTSVPEELGAPSLFASVTSGLRGTLRFSGRASRREFWQYFAVVFVLFAILSNLIDILTDPMEPVLPFTVVGLLLIAMALFISLIAMLARRLRDTGRRAWWLLLLLTPYASGALVLLVMAMGRQRDDVPEQR